MTHIKREKMSANKDTRWDRIRKRHTNNTNTNLKTETVKRFIEIDYIGRHQQNLLNGEIKTETNLDPVMVMDLRHEMFKQIPRKLPLATVAFQRDLEVCKSHNMAVEEHYIENQLQQFRQHLQKQHKRQKISEKKVHSLLIDNGDIMESLETSQKHIEDFYTAPMEALKEVNDLFKNELDKELEYIANEEIMETLVNEAENLHIEEEKNFQNAQKSEQQKTLTEVEFNEEYKLSINIEAKININESEQTDEPDENEMDDLAERFPEILMFDDNAESRNNSLRQDTPSPLADTEEVLRPLRDNIEHNNGLHLRCVRFDEDVSVCQFQRETSSCSNTSDGIDSVISDLAEEALFELQIEEETRLTTITETETETAETVAQYVIKQDVKLDKTACALQYSAGEKVNKLIVTGKIPAFVKRSPPQQRKTSIVVSTNSTEEDELETFSNNEQSKIIDELFQARAHTRVSIMRKYFLKWVHFTTIEKIEREHADGHADRVRRINIFLDKIRLEKNRMRRCQKTQKDGEGEGDATKKHEAMGNLKINKKYQNKIKVQQDIIDLQRLKLERQERIIMELKLSKLSEDAREARLELKNELKSVIRSGDAKSKAKAKCLQLIGNLRDEEDERLDKLQGKALLMPKFLQSMQERALERSVKHDQAKQRRLQQEAEKEASKIAVEEAKRQEDEEAKRLRLEALKEKRRQEKMAKVIKERERQRYLENQRKAQDFSRRLLLKRIGMEGFKRLLQRKKDNLRKCEELRKSLYKKTYFQAWFSHYRIMKARRYKKADELYERILKRKYTHYWLFYVEQERSKYNVAVDYHEMKLTETTFRRWFGYTKRMMMLEETKMKQAKSHHEWHLKWKVLDCWQRLPQILQLEKETEERRQRWRLKIWELLPDYTPNRDELNII